MRVWISYRGMENLLVIQLVRWEMRYGGKNLSFCLINIIKEDVLINGIYRKKW